MSRRGIEDVTLHVHEPDGSETAESLRRAVTPRMSMSVGSVEPRLDAVSTAEALVRRSLSGEEAAGAAALGFAPGAEKDSFAVLSERVADDDVHTVRFRHLHDDVPIYGSLVTVELDGEGHMLSLHRQTGQPDVSPRPEITAARAREVVDGAGGAPGEMEGALNFYFDEREERWRLVYLFDDVPARPDAEVAPPLAAYFVDAHDGSLVDVVTRRLGCPTVQAHDEDGTLRTFEVSAHGGGHRMHDAALGVHTRDLKFQPPSAVLDRYAESPPPWERAAVSAHVNSCRVAAFLRDVLGWDGVDGDGHDLVTAINLPGDDGGTSFANAYWQRGRAYFGQTPVSGSLRTWAAALDVVAHEFYHGVNMATANVEYRGEPGAAHESYSDLFGVIVANHPKPIDDWDWEIGKGLSKTGGPLRNVAHPAIHGDPEHMANWDPTPNVSKSVHTNSGIHNRAVHLILVAKDDEGKPLFDGASAAALLHDALTKHLGPTSGFAQSRNALRQAALTRFRDDSPARQRARLRAIDDAFASVGV